MQMDEEKTADEGTTKGLLLTTENVASLVENGYP